MTQHEGPPPRTELERLRTALEGRYRVDGELGRGGMATVYRAHDLKHDRSVAVKVLHPDVAAAYGPERFLSEIRVTARLQHPNVLPLFDSGEFDGLPFYVMPHVAGESLRERLDAEGPMPLNEAIQLSRGIASALDHAHRKGVVHRDVKPGNILLADHEPLVADFGIALATGASHEQRLTETNATPGTVYYMSPEQAVGDDVDERSDIYSLGCLVFEILTGRPPFTGRNAHAVRVLHASEPPPSVVELRPELDATVDDALRVAMAKAPEDRFQTATAFVEALEGTRPIPRRRTNRGYGRRVAVGAVAVVAAVAGWWAVSSSTAMELDPNRVLIYPLVQSAGLESSTVGEDVSALIGNALDGTGPLRWLDGWSLLDPQVRNDVRLLSNEAARDIARTRGVAHFITGRVLQRADSIEVLLDLHDARTDEVVARSAGVGIAPEAWRVGLAAVNDLLFELIPGTNVDIGLEWRDRHPSAIANFLLGESAFRRLQAETALGHYQDAVAVDSTFGVAALRGAQAASWSHRPSEASRLVTLAGDQEMAAHYEHFLEGYGFYLEGAADSAVAELEAALAIAPEMAVAWMQLGEVYTHLLPLRGVPDSIADAAFAEARRLDPTAETLLLHPIEIRLRAGDFGAAEPLIARFLAANPEDALDAKLSIMAECVREGPGRVAWPRLVADDPLPVLYAANAFRDGDPGLGCASAGFTALLHGDTAATDEADGRRWPALVGTFAHRIGQGDTEGAEALVDAFVDRWGFGSSLFLLVSPIHHAFVERAQRVARADEARWGENYTASDNPRRMWELGLYEAFHGRLDVAAAVADGLHARADAWGTDYERGLARSVDAVVTLARGDTIGAIAQLTDLVPHAATAGVLSWDEAEPRAAERLLLARVLLSVGQTQAALDVAAVFDSATPLVHALYLPESLEVRSEAARLLGDSRLETEFNRRLAHIRGAASGSTEP